MRRRTFVAGAIGAATAAGAAAVPLAAGAGSVSSGAPARHPGSASGRGGGSGPDSQPAPVTPECAADLGVARLFRGAWIGAFKNIDWPSRPGLPPRRQQQELASLLDLAVRLQLNAVLLQVRPTADAVYPSPYEPWSAWLTGAQGRSPGYDPLAFAIGAAHGRDLQLHAWFNPFRVSDTADRTRLAAAHPARQHPDWVVEYAGQLWYDPGNPAVRALALRVIADVASRYDVDGIHLDDYFYPYPVPGEEFADGATFRRYGSGFASRPQWRRHNIDLLVAGAAGEVRRIRPWSAFGVSPFGIWRNRSSDPAGSPTTGLQAYDDLYADVRTWIRAGWLDYVAPQLYWRISDPDAPYAELVRWWSAAVRGTGTGLYVGQAAYQAADAGSGWHGAELARHLAFDRTQPDVTGELFFHAGSLSAAGVGSQLTRGETGAATSRRPPVPQRLRQSLATATRPPPAGWLRRELLTGCTRPGR